VLEQLKDSRQLPTQIRVDNGPEFDSAKLHAWCHQHNIHLHFIQPGRPMQNGYVERFNVSVVPSTVATSLPASVHSGHI
jgi:putative transposase